MKTAPDQSTNELLASMPPAVWTRIAPQLEAVDLPLGRIGNSNALFCSQRPSGKALDHPLNRPLGLFAAR